MRIHKLNRRDRKTGKPIINKKGDPVKTRNWTIDFTDHHSRRHSLSGFSDKKLTERLADNIEALISCKVSNQQPSCELQIWILW